MMGFGGGIGEALHGLKPALFMVIVQFGFAGVNVFYKLAANDGMNLRIIVAYRFLFATAFILPIALFVERKSRPKLTWTVLFQAFLCGLFGGSLAQNLYVESLALTSATFVSAMTNLIPAITFLLAVSFRLEKANLGSITGKAKVLGALMGIGGAMVMTFYKGVELDIWNTHVNLLHTHNAASASLHAHAAHRLLGCLLAVGSCLSFALWLIVQAKMSEKYPCHYSSTALMSLMGSIQAIVFALCMERDWKQWKLGWNIRLLTVAYSGIVGTGLMVTLISWCVHMRGPLFVSVFNPLMLVLVAIAGSLVLNEKLHLGSVIAAVMIVIGLYVVLWGKGKEMKKITQLAPSDGFDDEPESISVVVTTPPLDNKLYDKDNDDNNDNNNHNNTVTSNSVVQAQPTATNATLEN